MENIEKRRIFAPSSTISDTTNITMNILVTTISPFPREKKENTYEVRVEDCDVQELKAFQTNESIIKCLSHYRPLMQECGIHKVVALVSKLCYEQTNPVFNNLTAYDYYKQVVQRDCKYDAEFVEVHYEDKGMAQILGEICNQINPGDVVYIDSAGGQRNISNVIQVLTKILKYKGIKNPFALYSSLQQGQRFFIESTDNLSRMLDLADAMHEFMTTGKADQLSLCFANITKTEATASLLTAMSDFSDKIRMGTVETLDETLKQMSEAIAVCKASQSPAEIESVILKQFLPIIEDKLLGTNQNGIDYVRIVGWCLDNVLIQQALTIFVEKIPVYIFNHGLVTFKGDKDAVKAAYPDVRKKNPTFATEWETQTFVAELLDLPIASVAKQCVTELQGGHSGNPDAERLANAIKKFKNMTIWLQKKRHANPIMQLIAEFRDQHQYASYDKMFKSMVNGISAADWEKLTGVKSSEKADSLTKKIMALQSLKEGTTHPQNLTMNIPSDQMAQICAGYLYVKAVRNQTNHASSKDSLTEECKKILTTYGYDFSNSALKTITRNIRHALQQILLSVQA